MVADHDDDVFDPFGLDEHEEELKKAAFCSFDLFPTTTEIAPQHQQHQQQQQQRRGRHTTSNKNNNKNKNEYSNNHDDDLKYVVDDRQYSKNIVETAAANNTTAIMSQHQSRSSPPHNNNNNSGRGMMPSPPPMVQRVSRSSNNNTSNNGHAGTTSTAAPTPTTVAAYKALPPKITVKLIMREDATAVATSGGSSYVEIVGTIQAQIQCSDAIKNAPFRLQVINNNKPAGAAGDSGAGAAAANEGADPLEMRTINEEFVTEQPAPQQQPEAEEEQHNDHDDAHNDHSRRRRRRPTTTSSTTAPYWHVYIPKHEIGLVHLMEFAVQQHIHRMPLLLERKISIKDNGNTVRVSIQVRTKLANKGDLKDLSIAIAVPMEVDGESICILRGDDGVYDELRRIVHWRLDELKRGESLMVAAEARLWDKSASASSTKNNTNYNKTPSLEFPVVLRASSNDDQISAIDCQAVPADGHPSSVTFTRSHSFGLLYRLQ